jgi:hypothetical protein
MVKIWSAQTNPGRRRVSKVRGRGWKRGTRTAPSCMIPYSAAVFSRLDSLPIRPGHRPVRRERTAVRQTQLNFGRCLRPSCQPPRPAREADIPSRPIYTTGITWVAAAGQNRLTVRPVRGAATQPPHSVLRAMGFCLQESSSEHSPSDKGAYTIRRSAYTIRELRTALRSHSSPIACLQSSNPRRAFEIWSRNRRRPCHFRYGSVVCAQQFADGHAPINYLSKQTIGSGLGIGWPVWPVGGPALPTSLARREKCYAAPKTAMTGCVRTGKRSWFSTD